jgi:hypothetical protein
LGKKVLDLISPEYLPNQNAEELKEKQNIMKKFQAQYCGRVKGCETASDDQKPVQVICGSELGRQKQRGMMRER